MTLARSADQKEQWREIAPPKAPYTISPGALLSINAVGVLKDQPIQGTYTVEPTGTVALGPAYGRVQVKGLTLEAAEEAIQKKLKEIFTKPEVQVTFAGWKDDDRLAFAGYQGREAGQARIGATERGRVVAITRGGQAPSPLGRPAHSRLQRNRGPQRASRCQRAGPTERGSATLRRCGWTSVESSPASRRKLIERNARTAAAMDAAAKRAGSPLAG